MSYGRAVNKRAISVNNSQLALIHVAKKELGLTDEDYRNILELYGGVTSAKFLTLEGFERVMAHLTRLGFRIKPTATKEGKGHKQAVYRASDTLRADPAEKKTPAQEAMLNHYFTTLGWTEAERRQGFCKRMIKKAWPQTRDEAAKVIEALKAMVARNSKSK
ncbi:regulatory protein GemA [Sporomusa sphaeroides DSM 2875]|uniref:regulatory protein GemA n=1 Tax=Sporomusa sphaeroides TaxID=47679 RepID=UPI00202E5F24|nr:regulatory protein GemA [Sporomusa sphaeroides]MCM0757367.1 regulatory protein GemA [Sporomusa sphaeroides DSM 2875]